MRKMPGVSKAQLRNAVIVMLDTSQDFAECSADLGRPVEQLFTPLTNYNPQDPSGGFGMDNGAFSNFDPAAFCRLLEKHTSRINLCRFVALPDVVGSARRTLECWDHWRPRMGSWPCAIVCQDGQENLPIPWVECTAVFIGGSTGWKLSEHAAQIVKCAKAIGKWVHVGRINTPDRFEYFERLGADSCDGSGLARYSHMRQKIGARMSHPNLFDYET